MTQNQLTRIFDQITQKMQKRGIAAHGDLVGVCDKEIAQLESELNISLPASYRHFMRSMGRSAGFLSPWMALYFDDLKEIQQQFQQLNAQLSNPLQLTQSTLLIAQCEHYFDAIDCNQSDPEILRMDLSDNTGKQAQVIAESFVQYLDILIDNSDSLSVPSDFFSKDDELFEEDIINF